MATPRSPLSSRDEQALLTELMDPRIARSPLNFVLFNYPWGREGTPLHAHKGPRTWQREFLTELGEHIEACFAAVRNGKEPPVWQASTVSGRGPGKSALVAWLVQYAMSCWLGSTTIVTANTESQLSTRTWPEVGRWHTMALNSHWFDRAATSLRPAPWFDALVKRELKIDTGYYYAQAQLWSEERPDAFAGAHNHHGIQVIFDEASGIPQPIWTVTEGFFTEPIPFRLWSVFSNGRRNVGPFFETHHRMRAHWRRRQIDSRTVEGVSQLVLNQIIEKFGEDSDEARVEVKGQFPRVGDKQFIGRDVIELARTRDLFPDRGAALVMGVDPARFGDDETAVILRQGRNARSLPSKTWKGMDTVESANRVAELIDEWQPDAVFVDGGGVGAGVIDQLKARGYRVIEVQFGAKASEPHRWADKRTEMWATMREWLLVGCIRDDADLETDLAGPEYGFVGVTDVVRLESKKDMTKRGLASPNRGDALALTFAQRVARRDMALTTRRRRRSPVASGLDYDILG